MKYDFVYALGDSFAYNEDVPKDKLFVEHIANYWSLPLVNRGVGGAGNNYIFRKAYKDCFDCHKGNPLVILIYTDFSRDEIYCNKSKTISVMNTSPHQFDIDFIKTYYNDHYNQKYLLRESLIRIKAVQTLLDHKKIDRIECFSMSGKEVWTDDLFEVYTKHQFDERYFMDKTIVDKVAKQSFILSGGGIGHPTEEGNQIIADWMIEKIKDLYIP